MPNPFVEHTRFKSSIRIKRVATDEHTSEMYTRDGEVVSDIVSLEKRGAAYDAKRFVKAYNDGLDVFIRLPYGAMKVMVYILKTLGSSDTFSLDLKRCMIEAGFSNRSSVYRALKELKEAKLIADSEDGEYYINPLCFYKGDRTKLTE